MKWREMIQRTVVVSVVVLAGCSGAPDATPSSAGDAATGEKIYASMCASCHGIAGEGGLGPALDHETMSETALAARVAATMPRDKPGTCEGQCSFDVAAFILQKLGKCDGTPLAPRQLRLLTRREYDATVRDLFGSCDLHTFVFPASGHTYKSVHVAGSFNGWPATIAAGGWAMTYTPSKDAWITEHTIPDGDYQYKFVIDESQWITDPNNPATAPDGLGGQNSALTMQCGADAAPSQDFPIESRPKGFAFDDDAAAGLVTSVHVDQYMRAAEAIAKRATANLSSVVSCDPKADAQGCAAELVRTLGKRVFRRPLADDEVATYAALITSQPDFSTGASVAIQVMLSSPYFLYRSEIGEELTPYEVASALSYLIWGTMPDDGLFAAAESGELSTPDGLEKQARRLLADPRARELIGTFGVQWLGVEPILTTDKSADLYPDFTPAVRQALEDETRAFIEHVVFDSTHAYDELLSADYTFANADLAALYGLSGPSSATLEMTKLPKERSGFLGHGSVLASYAHSDQTSPVKRGVWVRDRLLCQTFPTPPPNAGGLPPVDPHATTRQRFAQHSASATCHACHGDIDPTGFGFEEFDPIGRYRTTENGAPIDSSGDMNDVERLASGTHAPFSSLPELASILRASKAAPACFATQVYRFASGRLETTDDVCALRSIDETFEAKGRDVRELLVAIVRSPSFTHRKP